MDLRSAKLALQLQLNDLIEALDGLYDEPPEGDELASCEVMKLDLQRQLQDLEGQVMAVRLLKAEYEERLAYKKLIDEEKQAVGDHQLAMRLEGMGLDHPEVRSCDDYQASLRSDDSLDDDDENWQLAKKIYNMEMDQETKSVQSDEANEVKGTGKQRIVITQVKRRCDACLEYYPADHTLNLRCQPTPHLYCRGCLIDLFKTAIVDTTLFPPRCCKVAIPVDMCRYLLPNELVEEFDLKVEELATPNPTYCFDSKCNKFIRLRQIEHDVAYCLFCDKKTCAVCKRKEHHDLCPEDPHVKLLLDAAKRSHWQRCQKCRNMVELSHGCYHMT